MKTRTLIRIAYMTLIVLVLAYFVADDKDEAAVKQVEVKTPEQVEKPSETEGKLKSTHTLDVAFMSEAPDGNWTQPWSNACEETVTLMADKYYAGAKSIGISEAKSYLQNLFAKEEALFGTSRNSDSRQMLEIIEKYTDFKGRIVTNPSLDDIKKEIAAGRPVISLHRGFDLKNSNIEFSPTLSSYHTALVVGYDDDRQIFIVHDPGDEYDGEDHHYSYTLFMNSLHDYNYADNKADGPATVIFTSSK
jgi:hypothetical protein